VKRFHCPECNNSHVVIGQNLDPESGWMTVVISCDECFWRAEYWAVEGTDGQADEPLRLGMGASS
jgi:transcription elongation factor Elf1